MPDEESYLDVSLRKIAKGAGWANLWIATSIFAGVLMLLLWNYKPEKGEYE